MKGVKGKIAAVGAFLLLGAIVGLGAPATGDQQQPYAASTALEQKVRKELVTLPYYGVFDNLAFKVEGDTVTLSGQVVRPTTRSDAAARVAKIAGVDRVVNNIEVLPLSSFDDSIRIRTYRAVFSRGGLYRYAQGANPSVHIIVDNGHVTLEGAVSNKMDSQLAYMAASGVPGVFSVTNNLRVASGG
ncbi:MAG TPA: BON domain-containing protein [Blastocatellia bacterium]|nr:BON domain-containing protein [Blastocatellia bacterium]